MPEFDEDRGHVRGSDSTDPNHLEHDGLRRQSQLMVRVRLILQLVLFAGLVCVALLVYLVIVWLWLRLWMFAGRTVGGAFLGEDSLATTVLAYLCGAGAAICADRWLTKHTRAWAGFFSALRILHPQIMTAWRTRTPLTRD